MGALCPFYECIKRLNLVDAYLLSCANYILDVQLYL